MNKKRKLIGLFLVSFALLAVFSVAAAAISISLYADNDETRTADTAIVLGCSVENGEPSPVFRERINHAIRLYNDGYVDCLIFTGGIGDGDEVSEAFVAKSYAISMGIPEEVIFIEERSHITEENLENAKIVMDEKGLNTALLVSDPLHMKRAMQMAGDYGITAYSSPTTTTRYQTLKSKLPFLARETVLYIGYQIIHVFQ